MHSWPEPTVHGNAASSCVASESSRSTKAEVRSHESPEKHSIVTAASETAESAPDPARQVTAAWCGVTGWRGAYVRSRRRLKYVWDRSKSRSARSVLASSLQLLATGSSCKTRPKPWISVSATGRREATSRASGSRQYIQVWSETAIPAACAAEIAYIAAATVS